jgi:uncharacterized protein (DUF58 family)
MAEKTSVAAREGLANVLRQDADALAAALPALMVQAEQIANTLVYGVHGRRRAGLGESFWQFRHYLAGDSAQKIDWRQSGKSQNYYVRENEWQGAQSLWLWCDRSASMSYRSEGTRQSKQERALVVLLALASLLLRGGERVGLLGRAGTAPQSSRLAFAWLVEALVLSHEAPVDLPPLQALPRFSRLVLAGDFLSPLEEIAARLNAFAGKGVKGHVVQILDPAEEDLPFEGRVRFEGMQGEGSLIIGRAQDLRVPYRQLMQGHQAGLRELCRALGWGYTLHRTDRPAQWALLSLYQALSEKLSGAR